MPEIYSYKTILKPLGEEEIRIKNSKFISFVYPLKSSNEFKEIHLNLKKRYYDSTHICFAYRLLQNNEEYFRFNDDGEPSGTAGLPILNEIRRYDLYFIVVFVVRYYGGIKLGTGGLTKAYSNSARNVIEKSKIVKKDIFKTMVLDFDYSKIGIVMSVINREKLKIINNEFINNKNILTLNVPLIKYKSIKETIINSLSGDILIK